MTTQKLIRLTLAIFLLTVVVPAIGSAVTIDFDNPGLVHGQIITSIDGVNVSATNADGNGPDLAILFNSEFGGSTTDGDLLSPWDGGNLFGINDLGNMLIIAENGIDKNSDGVIDDPDDEGGDRQGQFFLISIALLYHLALT